MLKKYSENYCNILTDTYPKADWEVTIKPHDNGIELSVWPKSKCDHGATWFITVEDKHYIPLPEHELFDHDISVVSFEEVIELAGYFIQRLKAQFYSFASAEFTKG